MIQSTRNAHTVSVQYPLIKTFVDETRAWNAIKMDINDFPPEDQELLPGIKWGDNGQLYTPAFWKLQYLLCDFQDTIVSHRLADSLIEEITMCILGGYGIPSEVGIMAFNRLKSEEIIQPNVSLNIIHEALARDFTLKDGKKIKYRFYNQKSKYLFEFLSREDINCIPQKHDLTLRTWLLSIKGIGLKTASWITRNWLNSNNVAIIDIHLLRAGKLTGFFEEDVLTNYLIQERKYLEFCHALGVLPSNLDALIWRYMKNNRRLALKTLFTHT